MHFDFVFLVGFPALIAVGVAYLHWRNLTRPWLFLLASMIGLYIMYALAFYLAAPRAIYVDLVQPNEPPDEVPWLIELYAKPLLAFCIMAVPFVLLLPRLFRKGNSTKGDADV